VIFPVSQSGFAPRDQSVWVRSLYVGNLPFNTTADDLRDAFEQHGPVSSAQVVTDRETGRSRGFGFVEMESGGEQAIQAMNGADFQGRTLTGQRGSAPRRAAPLRWWRRWWWWWWRRLSRRS